jgi:hypothetical protein
MTMGYIALMIKPNNNPFSVWIHLIDGLGKYLGDCVVGIILVLTMAIVFISPVLYVFSRSFLVVEAFISLRRLPTSAYNTPSWTQYLAHL